MKRIYVIVLILLFISPLSCEKWSARNDLFPIDVGREYFFSYSGDDKGFDVSGNEKWTVESASAPGDKIIYNCTKVYTRAYYNSLVNGDRDTFDYKITESEFTISEDKKSHRITLGNTSFKRFQNEKEIRTEFTTAWTSESWIFKADSGMTYYYYYHKPNQWAHIHTHLDSLKWN